MSFKTTNLSFYTYLVTVVDCKQEDLTASKEKEQQLQAELDTTKRVSRAKDQQISDLKEELCGIQEKLMALREESSEQKEQKMNGEVVVPLMVVR